MALQAFRTSVDFEGNFVYASAMEVKLFLEEHVEPVFRFEFDRLGNDLSEMHKEMKSWDQAWRKESLAHYSTLGWSFVAEKEGQVVGYLIGQPILFFNNWTQTLWVEHLSFADPEVGDLLLDTAVRWAKTKHLQKVLVNGKSTQAGFVLEKVKGFKENTYLHLSTTKLEE